VTPAPTDTPTPSPSQTPAPSNTDTPTPTEGGDVSGGRRVKTGDASINGRISVAVILILAAVAIIVFRKRILDQIED